MDYCRHINADMIRRGYGADIDYLRKSVLSEARGTSYTDARERFKALLGIKNGGVTPEDLLEPVRNTPSAARMNSAQKTYLAAKSGTGRWHSGG